ncbi:MAG: hypothetical protein Ct9H300mP16_15160 [Pseudomonadota bacterium]|nr:MAG: hypothetical protein Ct9H300mP16_15160 [Pseudomonadota bacterium]
MGQLTTHVLDTASGQPAGGMAWTLRRADESGAAASGRTNAMGATTGLYLREPPSSGTYELVFFAGDYFRDSGTDLRNRGFWIRS